MDLRRLEQLIALAEEGTFVAAAERSHLSQPALSRSIRKLEQELGVRLFERDRHGAVLTPAGRRLLDRARRVLFEARGLARDADLLRDDRLGEVCFGAGSYPAAILLPRVLTTMAHETPDISVKVVVNDWATLQRQVAEEALDFALVEKRTLPAETPLESRLLYVEPAGWYVRANHPLARHASLMTRQLRGYPLVSVPLPASTLARLPRRLGMAPGEGLGLTIECNDLHALREVVLHSDAILSATATFCRQQVAEGRLTRLNVQDNQHRVEFALIQPARQRLSPAARRTITLIEQVATQRS